METEKHIYSVSEITRQIKEFLELEFGALWIEGEISNLKRAASGHIYFSLKDKNSQLRVVLFRSSSRAMRFTPADGMQVLVYGRVTVYANRGDYQLIAESLEPRGTGALQKAYEELKERLYQEGLFAQEHKKPIPQFPRQIGFITSASGAVVHDMLKVIKRRFANVQILIYPVRVQGEGAAREIAAAIKEMNKFTGFEVLILARGGGSLEDLWAFNEEVVARTIFSSRIPLISAIGHEVDYTIADFVADLRAPTPSAAAELVVRNKEDLLEKLKTSQTRMLNALENKIALLSDRLNSLKQRRIFLLPARKMEDLYQYLDQLELRLKHSFAYFLETGRQRLKSLGERLDSLNPYAILARGYSILHKLPERRIIKDSSKIGLNEEIEIKLFKGELLCLVKEIRNGKR